MDLEQHLSRLAVALGIGLLFGLERGWKTREVTPGSRAAGVRTFTLCGLLGGIAAELARATGTAEGAGLVLGLSFAVYAAIAAVFERDANRAAETYSATTIVAAMLTFLLGACAVIGDMRVAAAAAVAATGILAAREDIHRWVERITWPELSSALVLLAMTFIVLPVIPDTTIGPSGGVNPRDVWLIAIVLAGVSFIGYGAIKLFGAEWGVLLAGLAGGLVSSTAVTISSARRAAAERRSGGLLAAGVAVATAVSFVRVIVIAGITEPSLLGLLTPPLAAAAAVAAGYGLVLVYRRGSLKAGSAVPAEFRNPFSLLPVVGFALFLALVMLLGHAIGEAFGSRGALLGAIAIGLGDVDSVTIAMARLVPVPLGTAGAATAILGAVASNMVAKLAMGVALGGGRFALHVALMTAACWLAAGLALWGTLVFMTR